MRHVYLRLRAHARTYSISNPDRRLVHNVSERHRRNSIKKGFADLKTCVPLSGREKHSKVDILNKGASTYDPKKKGRWPAPSACMHGSIMNALAYLTRPRPGQHMRTHTYVQR